MEGAGTHSVFLPPEVLELKVLVFNLKIHMDLSNNSIINLACFNIKIFSAESSGEIVLQKKSHA